MPHESVLFTGGIAMFRRVQVRFSYYYYRRGGHEYDCSGRDDMLLNHKHYTSVLILRLSSVNCLVLVVGTRANWRHRDDRSMINEWQPKPTRDLRPSLVGTDSNDSSWDRWTSHDASVVFRDTLRAPKPDVRRSRPRSIRSDRTTTNEHSVWYARRSDQQESSIAVAIGRLPLHVSRHACADRPTVETRDTFLMIAEWMVTITPLTWTIQSHELWSRRLFAYVNNSVTIIVNGSSVCEVNKVSATLT